MMTMMTMMGIMTILITMLMTMMKKNKNGIRDICSTDHPRHAPDDAPDMPGLYAQKLYVDWIEYELSWKSI